MRYSIGLTIMALGMWFFGKENRDAYRLTYMIGAAYRDSHRHDFARMLQNGVAGLHIVGVPNTRMDDEQHTMH